MTMGRIHICPLPHPTPSSVPLLRGTLLAVLVRFLPDFFFVHAIILLVSFWHNYRTENSGLFLTWVRRFPTHFFLNHLRIRCRHDDPLAPYISVCFLKTSCFFSITVQWSTSRNRHGCDNTMISSTVLVKVWPAAPLVSFTATPWPWVAFSGGDSSPLILNSSLLRLSLFWPWHSWRAQAKYFPQGPFIWVWLAVSLWLDSGYVFLAGRPQSDAVFFSMRLSHRGCMAEMASVTGDVDRDPLVFAKASLVKSYCFLLL